MFAIGKRIFLFLVVNIFVMLTLSIVTNLICAFLGVDPSSYFNYIIIFGVVFGFGGAFISLLTSKWVAKNMMGVKIIDPYTNEPQLRKIVSHVHNLARQANLQKMPEVGIYQSPTVNAFATGPSKNNSLVAVSTGLLQKMQPNEVEGVLAHEVAHISNGDMVTMTLIQGVINAVVLILARLVANIILSQTRSSNDDRPSPFLYMGIVFGLEIVFSFLGAIVVNYFSRVREFRADKGGAKYAGREKMIAALRALQHQVYHAEPEQQALATLKISGRSRGTLMALFSTHPPLEQRIRRLEMSK